MIESNSEDDNEEELLRKKKKKSKKKKKKASQSNWSSSSESHFDYSRERKKKKKETSPELFPSIRDVSDYPPQSIDESTIFPSTSTSYGVQDGPSSGTNPKHFYEDLRHKIERRRSECHPSWSRSRSRYDVPRHEKFSNLPRYDRSSSPKRHHLSPIEPGYDLSLSLRRMSPSPYERPPGPSTSSHKRRLISSRHSRSPSPPPRRRRLSSSRYSRSPSAYHHSELPKRHNRPSSPPRYNPPPSSLTRGGPRIPSPHSQLHSPPRRRPPSPPVISPREIDRYRHMDKSRDERYQDSSASRSNTHRYRGFEMPEQYPTTVYRRRNPGPSYSRARHYSEHRDFTDSGIKQEKNYVWPSGTAAVTPNTEISLPQRDDKPSTSPDEEVYIINESGYYAHITINENEQQRYYITKKLLIRSAKKLLEKVAHHVDKKLMTYVMHLRVEERIGEMLKDEKTIFNSKQILKMYRDKYPITGDEEFVTETLHAIWLGKYNDGVRPKKRLKNKSVVPVKQEAPDADVKQERPDNEDENEVPQTSASVPSVKQEPTEQPSTSGIAVKTEKPDAEQSEATQSITIKAEPVEALISTVTPKTEKPDSSDGGATVVSLLADVDPAPLNPIKEERLEESVPTITVNTERAESVDDITSVYKSLKIEPPTLLAIKTETTATKPAQIKDTVEMPQPLQDTKINSSSYGDDRITKDDEEVAVIEPDAVTVDLCAIEEFNVGNMKETLDKPEIEKKIKQEKDYSQNQIKIKKEADSSKMSKNIKMETPDTHMEAPKEKNTFNVKKEVNTDEVAEKMKKEAKTSEDKKKRQHTVNVSEAQTEIENKTPAVQNEIKNEINTNKNLDQTKKRKNTPEEKTNTVEGQKIKKNEIGSEFQIKRVKIIDTSAEHKEEKKSITIREDQRQTEETNNASEGLKAITKSTNISEMAQEIKIKINISDMHKAVIEKIMHTSESQNKNKSEKDTPKLPHKTKNKIISTEGPKELEKTIQKTEVSTKKNDNMDTLEEQEELKNRTNTSDEPKETEQIKQNFEKQNLIKDSTYTSKIKHETKNKTDTSKEHKKTVNTVNTSEVPQEMNIRTDASNACKEEDKIKNTSEKLNETKQTINILEMPKKIDNRIDMSEVQNKTNTSETHKETEKMMEASEDLLQKKMKISTGASVTQLEIKTYSPEIEEKTEVIRIISETQNDGKKGEDAIALQKEMLKINNTLEAQKEVNETAELPSVHQETVTTSNTSEKQMYTIDLLDDDLEREMKKPHIITKDTEDASEAQKVTEPFVIDVSDEEQEPGEPEEYVQRQAADTTEQQQPIVVVDSDSDDKDNGNEPGSYVEISDEESEDGIVRTRFNETPATSKLSGHRISNPTQESIVQLATTQDSSRDITAPTQKNSNDAPTTQPGGHDITHPTPNNSSELVTSTARSHDITVQTNNDVRTTQPTDKINESILPIDKDTEPNFVNNEPTNVETTNNPTRMESDETTNPGQAETEHNAAESVENIKQFLLSLPIE